MSIIEEGDLNAINRGEIGIPFNEANKALFGTNRDDKHWLHRGNVYGAGSGIGKYEIKDAEDNIIEVNSSNAGSVTHSTSITIGNGIDGVAGTQASPGNVIYRNIYGGGSLASVAPPVSSSDIPNPFDSTTGLGKKFFNLVSVAGTVGVATGYDETYGGEVYGGSRGEKDIEHPEWFAVSVWTKVHIKNGARIMGNVFGGGDNGKVKKDTDVIIGGE